MQGGAKSRRTTRWDSVLTIAALIVMLALLLGPPNALLDKADRAAYAVCHRIPGHSFVLGGRQMALCARCSGTYLGAAAGLAALGLRRRGRASRLPAPRHMAVLALFVLAWAVDGLNSYLALFAGLPYLYEPNNVLRLATGTLEGLAIAAFLLPVLNLSLWMRPLPEPSVASWRELVWMGVGGLAVVGLVASGWAPLLYPLALLSGLAIVGLIGAVNTVLVLALWRREGRATRWGELVMPISLGMALALLELAAVGAARAVLTERLALPF